MAKQVTGIFGAFDKWGRDTGIRVEVTDDGMVLKDTGHWQKQYTIKRVDGGTTVSTTTRAMLAQLISKRSLRRVI